MDNAPARLRGLHRLSLHRVRVLRVGLLDVLLEVEVTAVTLLLLLAPLDGTNVGAHVFVTTFNVPVQIVAPGRSCRSTMSSIETLERNTHGDYSPVRGR